MAHVSEDPRPRPKAWRPRTTARRRRRRQGHGRASRSTLRDGAKARPGVHARRATTRRGSCGSTDVPSHDGPRLRFDTAVARGRQCDVLHDPRIAFEIFPVGASAMMPMPDQGAVVERILQHEREAVFFPHSGRAWPLLPDGRRRSPTSQGELAILTALEASRPCAAAAGKRAL